MKWSKKIIALSVAALMLVPGLAACSQSTQTSALGSEGVQSGNSAGGNSSQEEIVGKVTSVAGNQVVLALGTLPENPEGGRKEKGYPSSSPAPEDSSRQGASSEAASTSSSSDTDEITLTGESKTVLIPVGLTLSRFSGKEASQAASGVSSSGASAAEETPPGGGNNGGGQPPEEGAQAASGMTVRAAGGTQTQRSSDFSSIQVGMILRIVQDTESDGSERIVSVSIVSE